MTNDEAREIFHEALEACGQSLIDTAQTLRVHGDRGLAGDDIGDDLDTLVVCIGWLNYVLNANYHDEISVETYENSMERDGEHVDYADTWLADVLTWAVGNKEAIGYNDFNYHGNQDYDPTVELWAWRSSGAPSCKLQAMMA